MIGAAILWVGGTREAGRKEAAARPVSAYSVDSDAPRNVSNDFRWFDLELARMASERGLSIPLKLNAERIAAYEGRVALDGAEFDRLRASSALEMRDAARSLPQVEHGKIAISRASLLISLSGIE